MLFPDWENFTPNGPNPMESAPMNDRDFMNYQITRRGSNDGIVNHRVGIRREIDAKLDGPRNATGAVAGRNSGAPAVDDEERDGVTA